MLHEGPDINFKNWKQYNNILKYTIEECFKQETATKTVNLIDGNDIINIFGLKPGPIIGKILSEMHESEAIGEIKNKQEALAYVAKKLKDAQPKI